MINRFDIFGRGKRKGVNSLILLYHRVADVECDPQLLSVSHENFKAHLECITHDYTPVSLQALLSEEKQIEAGKKCVAITFDDGYADNLYNAKPLLDSFRVPATVFVTSEATLTTSEFWWDTLERIFLRPGVLPERLKIVTGGMSYERQLGQVHQYAEGLWRQYKSWNVLEKRDPTERHRIYKDLCALLRPRPAAPIDAFVGALSAWAGPGAGPNRHQLPLSQQELEELSKSSDIEIGSHGATHCCLSSMSLEEQEEEIRTSKIIIESTVKHRIDKFSYPFGAPSDYSARTQALLKTAGFLCACSTTPGVLKKDTNPFELPRLIVRNWDGREFKKRLQRALNE